MREAAASVSNKLPIVLLLMSLCLNVVLVHRNKSLQSTIEEAEILQPGSHVSSLRFKSTSGAKVNISFPTQAEGTLIYYFRPTCMWCMRNRANFEILARKLQSLGYRILPYTLEHYPDQEYAKVLGQGVEVFTDDDQDVQRVLKLSGTPDTILISRSGIVLAHWGGAFSDENLRSIESRFGIHLPGLVLTPPPQKVSGN